MNIVRCQHIVGHISLFSPFTLFSIVHFSKFIHMREFMNVDIKYTMIMINIDVLMIYVRHLWSMFVFRFRFIFSSSSSLFRA